MKKKGFTEAQITWIFILIAGAVFILIFTKIAGQQKQVSDTKISGLTLTGFNSQLTSLSISKNAFHPGELPKAEMKVTCDKYSIGKNSKAFGNIIVFSPDRLKGSKYLAMTLPWEAPFKVTNFIYLTHPEVRYVFVDKGLKINGELAKDRIKNIIPDSLKDTGDYKIFDNPSTIEDLNNYKVRIVYFGTDTSLPPSLPNTKDSDITKLEIVSDKEIRFYKNTATGWGTPVTSYYLDDASLLGAIFTEDKETYECVMQKAFGLLENEAKFYNAVETKLETEDTTNCQTIHTGAKTDIDSISTLASNLKTAIAEADTSALKGQISSLQTKNSEAEQKSCILIY